MQETISPWDRQLDETEKAFLRFKKYREMGSKRSLRTLAHEEKVQLSAIASISTKHHWQSRASAWDTHVDKVSQQSEIDEICAMKKRQISLALKAQRVAQQGLEKLISHLENNYKDGSKIISQLRPLDLSKLLDTGCRLERLNRDEPEQNLEIKQQQNFDLLNEQELELLHQLIAKAEGQP